MQTKLKPGAAVSASVLFLLVTHPAFSQSYSIGSYKIAGGGGSHAGGPYALKATIGQFDASTPEASGNYVLNPGFPGLFAVQTAGSPTLNIQWTNSNTAKISWPATPSGFSLQSSTNLAESKWLPATEAMQAEGAIKFIIVNPVSRYRFYRLKSP